MGSFVFESIYFLLVIHLRQQTRGVVNLKMSSAEELRILIDHLLRPNSPSAMTKEPSQEFGIESSIPILRMLDETKARSFYVDFLGFKVEWEHRFDGSPNSPLYMQIRLGDAVIHLNGHAEEDAPVAEVRIPVHRLDDYCEYLRSKTPGDEKPEIVDPRYEGKNTDMNLYDPSGNFLVFWLAKPENG
jgi:hypothetical protein